MTPWRIHVEENNVENFRYRDEDGWMWEDLRGRGDDRPVVWTPPVLLRVTRQNHLYSPF